LIFVDKEGSEVASSPQPGPPARIGPVLHLLCESNRRNKPNARVEPDSASN